MRMPIPMPWNPNPTSITQSGGAAVRPMTSMARRGPGMPGPLRLLEKLVEGVAGVFGIARRGRAHCDRRRRRHVVGAFAGHRHPRHKRIALVGLVLHGDAHQDGLEALETHGWLEVGTLLAAVQPGVALGAVAAEVHVGR